MKYAIFVFFFLSCSGKRQPKAEKQLTLEQVSTNDSICSHNLPQVQMNSLAFVHGCIISYGKESCDEFAKLSSVGKLAREFNYNTASDTLKYLEINDTVVVKKLFVSNLDGYKLELQGISQLEDTVLIHLTGNANSLHKEKYSSIFSFYEMELKFIQSTSLKRRLIFVLKD